MRAPSFSLLFSALLGGAVAGCNGKQAKCLDASLVVLSGTPVGKEVQHDNRESDRSTSPAHRRLPPSPPSHTLYHQARQEERPRQGTGGHCSAIPERHLRPPPPREQTVRP